MPSKYKYTGESMSFHYIARLHYGTSNMISVYCDMCRKTISHNPCMGYSRPHGGPDVDLCLPCVRKLHTKHTLKFKPCHKVPHILVKIPTHLHIINYGNMCIKETGTPCLRCGQITTLGMESNRGFYCTCCVDKLCKLFHPLDDIFVKLTCNEQN